jgi:hypothetical protein
MITGLMRSLILALLLFCSGFLFSQHTYQDLDRVYGLDPLLFNGKKYSYFLPSGTGGNQFFSSAEFVWGGIVVMGFSGEVIKWKSDKDLLLNYDVFNQKLLLKFFDETGAEQIIEISEAWLESFNLGPVNFIYVRDNDKVKIYQALGDGKFKMLHYWRKDLKLTNTATASYYAFSSPIKENFVLIEGIPRPFRSKGSFIKLFNPGHRVEIKNYLQANGINLKKASDQAMTDLINYIGNQE